MHAAEVFAGFPYFERAHSGRWVVYDLLMAEIELALRELVAYDPWAIRAAERSVSGGAGRRRLGAQR
jgi:hypothetical protein